MRFLTFACVVAFGMLTHQSLRADVVHRRAGMPAIQGRIVKFDDAGVTIDRGASQPEFVRWDFVRDFQVDRAEPGLAPYREISVSLWRARTRLERNDFALAEPIFERLFQHYRGQSNEASLLVAEGLLRCRLIRGANEAAVLPALEAIRMRRTIKPASPIFAGLPQVFDDVTSLCSQLPPVWVVSSELVQLERELSVYNAGIDTTVASLATLYLKAVRHQIGAGQDEQQRTLAADHPGVAYLTLIMELHDPAPARRAAACDALLRDSPNAPPWQAAWNAYFIGVSRLAETDATPHDAGLVNLATVPARYGEAQPYLAGLAIARLAEACEIAGEAAAAGSLRNELLVRFPTHPVLATMKRSVAILNARPLSAVKESL